MHIFFKENIARHILMFQRNKLLIWLQWANENETKKNGIWKDSLRGLFSCNTFLLVEDGVIEIANFLWLLMVNDRYVCMRNSHLLGEFIRRRVIVWLNADWLSIYRRDNSTDAGRSHRNSPDNGSCCTPSYRNLQEQ